MDNYEIDLCPCGTVADPNLTRFFYIGHHDDETTETSYFCCQECLNIFDQNHPICNGCDCRGEIKNYHKRGDLFYCTRTYNTPTCVERCDHACVGCCQPQTIIDNQYGVPLCSHCYDFYDAKEQKRQRMYDINQAIKKMKERKSYDPTRIIEKK